MSAYSYIEALYNYHCFNTLVYCFSYNSLILTTILTCFNSSHQVCMPFLVGYCIHLQCMLSQKFIIKSVSQKESIYSALTMAVNTPLFLTLQFVPPYPLLYTSLIVFPFIIFPLSLFPHRYLLHCYFPPIVLLPPSLSFPIIIFPIVTPIFPVDDLKQTKP